MTAGPPLSLFAATGVELEYMIVDQSSLQVRPISDELIKAVTGTYTSHVSRGRFAWSNELVLHVLELKTSAPVPTLDGVAAGFQAEVDEVNARLHPLGAALLPTAMHPWMNPRRHTRLWPHDHSPIYQAYHRIFGCQGHGWSNLQSAHLNLPFANDAEFGRLHAAIRAVLPLLPALAASSPMIEGRLTGVLDNRLVAYRSNSDRVPSVTGDVVPEPVFTRAMYEREILQRMYRDIAPLDPEGVLQDEFLNSRGAIARFERGSIEIRLLDVQECPAADLAIARLVLDSIRALVDERWVSLKCLQRLDTRRLASTLDRCIRDAEQAVVSYPDLLAALGGSPDRRCSAQEIWRTLAHAFSLPGRLAPKEAEALRVILERGPLARRIVQACGVDPARARVTAVYADLRRCLAEGRPFPGPPEDAATTASAA